MKSQVKLFFIFIVAIVISMSAAITAKRKKAKEIGMYNVFSVNDVVALFPKTPSDIKALTERGIAEAQKKIDEIVAIAHDKRNYYNTAHAFDELCSLSRLAIGSNLIEILEMVSPAEDVRKAAHEAIIAMQEFAVEKLSNNKALYEAFKAYATGNANKEHLSEEQRYYITKTVEDFERAGLSLPNAELETVMRLKKELATLELNFGTNVAQDNRSMQLKEEDLQGVAHEFLNGLKRADDGSYTVGVDYPTYFTIMENCTNSHTRRRLYELFNNRAFPVNEQVLKDIIEKRDQLAHLLGYESYADLDLSDQMVKSVEHAEQFIADLSAKSIVKEEQEFKELISDLPESVQLTAADTMNPWDVMFAKNYYKKNYYNIDESAIAEYFPMEKTVKGLLDIYQKFFSLRFKEVAISGAWHDEVSLIEVFDKKNNQIGYLFLDLYPRPNKYSHACQVTIIPATYVDGKPNPSVALVVANFPKSTGNTPSLLKRKDVTTFFHEFGHALHALLGRTMVASFSGTHVKRDFVEMPSQMLEEWMVDKAILKLVSCHYKTGKPLSDEMIENIVKVKNVSSGAFVQTQLFYSQLSLDCFKAGAQKDVFALYQKLYQKMRPFTAADVQDRMYVSFGHLTGYGAKYYGYMWSKVFALDLFQEIQKHGLLDPEIGSRYVQTVIGKGGSKDPNALLKKFLGREPNQEAFLKDLGL